MLRYKKLVYFLVAAALFVVAWLFVGYRLSLRTLVINYENISSVSIFKTEKLDAGEAGRPIAEISSSGKKYSCLKAAIPCIMTARRITKIYMLKLT